MILTETADNKIVDAWIAKSRQAGSWLGRFAGESSAADGYAKAAWSSDY